MSNAKDARNVDISRCMPKLLGRIGLENAISEGRLKTLEGGILRFASWLEDHGIETFMLSHVDSFMCDAIEDGFFAQSRSGVTKAKVDNLRNSVRKVLEAQFEGMGHFTSTGFLPHNDYWNNSGFKEHFDGFWFAHKKLDIEYVSPKLRGVINEYRLSQILKRAMGKWTYHKKKDRSKQMKDALTVIFGCCLRKMEFILLRSGDYDPATRTLILRCNKSADANRNRPVHYQTIHVGHDEAHRILSALQMRKAKGAQLFPVEEASTVKLTQLIKMTAQMEGWPPELSWCLHALRHGGAQYFFAKQQADNTISNQQLVKWTHMSIMTLHATYGLTEEARLQKINDIKVKNEGREPALDFGEIILEAKKHMSTKSSSALQTRGPSHKFAPDLSPFEILDLKPQHTPRNKKLSGSCSVAQTAAPSEHFGSLDVDPLPKCRPTPEQHTSPPPTAGTCHFGSLSDEPPSLDAHFGEVITEPEPLKGRQKRQRQS